MNPELLACPFCGYECAKLEKCGCGPGLYRVECGNPVCLVRGPLMHGKLKAVQAWNRRVQPQSVRVPECRPGMIRASDWVFAGIGLLGCLGNFILACVWALDGMPWAMLSSMVWMVLGGVACYRCLREATGEAK